MITEWYFEGSDDYEWYRFRTEDDHNWLQPCVTIFSARCGSCVAHSVWFRLWRRCTQHLKIVKTIEFMLAHPYDLLPGTAADFHLHIENFAVS